jgi:hypothetical protein
MEEMIPIERVESRICLIRVQKVMLDYDLANLYEVATKVLNQAVKRNLGRFPADFMFSLTKQEIIMMSQSVTSSSRSQFVTLKNEVTNLKSQFVTSSLPSGKVGWGGRRKLPYAFTEQGIAMLSSVLNSERAVQVNIMIMRAFVKLRQTLAQNKELAEKFQELEARVGDHDTVILQLVEEIKKITNLPVLPAIGFELPRRGEGDG